MTPRIGDYEVVCQLARGGMAELLLARHGEQLVVLKKILPQYARNPRFVNLFLAEADLVAKLDHPGIAKVYALQQVDNDYFLAMEYILGKDVRSTLRRTTQRNQVLPLGAAVQIARDVAVALHYAHERRQPDGSLLGIVHRDVSPSNIVVSYEGVVKLVDFGIAKATATSVKTRTGMLRGKVQYMSPEQARGTSLDRRSDVFSLGIVLWELLTAKRLFQAENDLATIQQIIHSKPPVPSTLRADCPPELDRITLHALATDPDARYQTADELDHDLARVASQLGAVGALRAHMQRVFEPEITAWTEAQEAGLTLVDHVIATGIDLVTPNSESEDDDQVDDDGDESDSSALLVDELELPTFLVAPDSTRELDVPLKRAEAIKVTGPIKVAAPARVAMLDELEAPTVLAGEVDQDTTVRRNNRAPELVELEPEAREETRPARPSQRAPSTVFVDSSPIPTALPHTPSGPIPVAFPHTPSGPLVVTTYPRLESDPSYERISLDRKPEAPPRRQNRHFALVVLLAAVLIGMAAAVIGSQVG